VKVSTEGRLDIINRLEKVNKLLTHC